MIAVLFASGKGPDVLTRADVYRLRMQRHKNVMVTLAAMFVNCAQLTSIGASACVCAAHAKHRVSQ